MPLYHVHLYREMRLKYERIEAATPEAAAAIARDKITGDADLIDDECDGETFAALVDLVDDEQFEHSVTIDFEPEHLRKAAPSLLEALIAVLPYARAEAEGLEGFRRDDEAVAQEADRAWTAVEQADALLGTIPHSARRPS